MNKNELMTGFIEHMSIERRVLYLVAGVLSPPAIFVYGLFWVWIIVLLGG